MLSVLTPGNCTGSPGPSDSEWSMTKLSSDTRNRAAMEGAALPTTAKPFAALTSASSLDASLISCAHSWNASNNSWCIVLEKTDDNTWKDHLPVLFLVSESLAWAMWPEISGMGTAQIKVLTKKMGISLAIVWHSRTAQTKILPYPTPKDAYNLLEVTVLGSVYIQKDVRKILTMTKLLS